MCRKYWTLILALIITASTVTAFAALPKKPAPSKRAVVKSTDAKVVKKPEESRPQAKKPSGKADLPKQLPKLLDLGATKCIPCKMMAPILDSLKEEYKGQLKVEFIDVWENRDAAEKYKISGIPTQIFFDANGKEFYRHAGYFPKEDIIAKFKDHGINLKK